MSGYFASRARNFRAFVVRKRHYVGFEKMALSDKWYSIWDISDRFMQIIELSSWRLDFEQNMSFPNGSKCLHLHIPSCSWTETVALTIAPRVARSKCTQTNISLFAAFAPKEIALAPVSPSFPLLKFRVVCVINMYLYI